MAVRVTLDKGDFQDLVAGKIVYAADKYGGSVEIILKDIGFFKMEECIQQAELDMQNPL